MCEGIIKMLAPQFARTSLSRPIIPGNENDEALVDHSKNVSIFGKEDGDANTNEVFLDSPLALATLIFFLFLWFDDRCCVD